MTQKGQKSIMKKCLNQLVFIIVVCIPIIILITSCNLTTKVVKPKKELNTFFNSNLKKIILFPDDNIFNQTRDFYHDVIGFKYTKTKPSKWWVEFATGDTLLCLHHNNCYKDEFGQSPKRMLLSFLTENEQDLKEKYQKLKTIYKVSDSTYTNKTERLGLLNESERSVLFIVRDPMGNDIRFYARKK